MSSQLNTLCQISRLHLAWSIVKAKGTAGGIDGMTIAEFDKIRHKQIPALAEQLKKGTWKPLPYLEVSIPKSKNPNETRKIGMTSICDKIVQHALKSVIEPRLERLFLGNSYGYRPHKGVMKAIRRVLAECSHVRYQFVLRLDIDDYFDTIDHDILRHRLAACGIDSEIIRLVMLCVQMGKVRQGSREWIDTDFGTPQGNVLSPLLSNLYLHSFDQFAVSKGVPYVRYADDFLFLCESRAQAEDILSKTEGYLKERLGLTLNQPTKIVGIKDGFDFLGITIVGGKATVSQHKREDLNKRINTLEIDADGFTAKSVKSWSGLQNYYAKLLPQSDLEHFDTILEKRLVSYIHDHMDLFSSKSRLQYALGTIAFLSQQFQQRRKQIIDKIISEFLETKYAGRSITDKEKNRRLIQERKREFRKKAAEASGLLVNKPGTFIGLTNRGITVSQKGKVIAQYHPDNLSQIIVTGQGVSLSSNLMNFCMTRKIPIDFFDKEGKHLGSVITSKHLQNSLWAKQACADISKKNKIAQGIIEGKIKNQFSLVKYFNKYHKLHYPSLRPKYEAMEQAIISFKEWKKTSSVANNTFVRELVGHEAQVAFRYWDYIRELFSDDDVGFLRREHTGAQDLVNSMLNYGYALLYVRVWQALLAARLNPFESLIHTRQEGKPTLVYDMIEIFRSQVVDRVVISLVQKKQELEVRNGLLTDGTRQILVKSIMERLVRYEKFQGEDIKMEDIILRQCKLLANDFAGTASFKPYVAKW